MTSCGTLAALKRGPRGMGGACPPRAAGQENKSTKATASPCTHPRRVLRPRRDVSRQLRKEIGDIDPGLPGFPHAYPG